FLYCVVLASAYDDLYTYLFTDPYTPWIHSLSLHDALPISEDTALGGQAGTSPRIENYLGFPAGLSGEELAARAALQAHKFGARMKLGSRAVALSSRLDTHHVRFEDGELVSARSVIIATGARYNRLQL